MHIVVCVKEVPKEFRVDPSKKKLIREGIKGEINPADQNAIELAVRLKERQGGKVTLVTMGRPQRELALLKGLAMGGDEAVLLSDPGFGDADTLATSYTLASGIRKLPAFDLIICGNETTHSGTGQVPIQLAEHLKLPQITGVTEVELRDGRLRARRSWGEEYQIIEARLPLLITVVKGINEPRLPTIPALAEAAQKPIYRWNASDIEAEESRIGSKGSGMHTMELFPLETKKRCEMLSGTPEQVVVQLVGKLQERGILT